MKNNGCSMQQFKCIAISFLMIVSTEYVLAMPEGNKFFVNVPGVEARKPFTPFSDAIARSLEKRAQPVVVDGVISVKPEISHENSENKSAPQSEKISNVDSSNSQWSLVKIPQQRAQQRPQSGLVDGEIAVSVINHESSVNDIDLAVSTNLMNNANQIASEKKLNVASQPEISHENSENKPAPQSEKIFNVDSSNLQWMHDYPELSLIDEAPYDNSTSDIHVNNNIFVPSDIIISLDDANKLIESSDKKEKIKGYNARIAHDDRILNQENNIIDVSTEALAKEKNLSNRVNLQKKIATAKSAYNIAKAQKNLDNLNVEYLKFIEEHEEIVQFYEGPQKDNITKAIESKMVIDDFASKLGAEGKLKTQEQKIYNQEEKIYRNILSNNNLTDEQIAQCMDIYDFRYAINIYDDALLQAVAQSQKQEAQQLKNIAQVQVFVNEIFNLLSLYISDAAAFARIKAELVADAMPTWVKSWSDVSFFNWIFKFQRAQHYKTLGLKLSANKDDIRQAYYDLNLKYHPDKFQSKLSSEKAATMSDQEKKDFIAQEKKENATKLFAIQKAYKILTGFKA